MIGLDWFRLAAACAGFWLGGAFRCFDKTAVITGIDYFRLLLVCRIRLNRWLQRVLRLLFLTGTFAISLCLPFAILTLLIGLAFAVLPFLLFSFGVHLSLRFAKQAHVVLGMLLKIFGRHPVSGKLRVARQLVVLVNDLLRRAAYFAFGARTVEYSVYNVATATGVAIAVTF